MVSYNMRMHTCPLDGERKSVERCRLFRMSPRDMAIACLSWWELPKSSWQILTFSKHRPATSWPSCCMMVACITVAEKAKISREVWPFSISRGRHMLWMPSCMCHAPRAVLRDHYFCRTENTCSAMHFVKKMKGSLRFSIAKQRVPCMTIFHGQHVRNRISF